MVDTGADVALNYYWEDSFATDSPSDTTAKVFGSNLVVDTAEGNNQLTGITRPGSNNYQDFVEGPFIGRWGVRFNITNPWWVRSLFGEPSTVDNGDGTYTHTYSSGDGDSMQIGINYLNGDDVRVLEGCVPQQASVSVSPGQDPQVTLTGQYAGERLDTGTTAQVTTSERQLTFAQSHADFAGSEKLLVQSADLNLGVNAEVLNAIGTRFGVGYVSRLIEPDLNITQYQEGSDVTDIEEFYGGSGETEPQDNIDNEVSANLRVDNEVSAGSGKNSMEFQLSGTLNDSFGDAPIGDPRQEITERIRKVATDMTVVATNETATAP